jgi:hypothetical protein
LNSIEFYVQRCIILEAKFHICIGTSHDLGDSA